MEFWGVVALSLPARCIGIKNRLPWNLPEDLKHFAQLTRSTQDPLRRNAVIMGRLTWESLPAKARPLPGRLNVVLSRGSCPGALDPLVSWQSSLDGALEHARLQRVERAFVIGGANVYAQALGHRMCAGVYVTEVLTECAGCDAFFPAIDEGRFERVWEGVTAQSEAAGLRYRYVQYRRRPPGPAQKPP